MQLTLGINASPALEDLFVKETAFTLARERILEAIAILETDIAVIGKRPRWTQIFKSTAALQREKHAAQADMHLLRTGLDRLLTAEGRLLGHIDYLLENHLRRHDPGYVTRLAAHNYPGDWERLARRFDYRMQSMQQLVAEFRARVATLQPESRVEANTALAEDLRAMQFYATALDDEITFFNLLADPQGGMTRQSPGLTSADSLGDSGWRAIVDELPRLAVNDAFALLTTIGSKLTATSLLITSEMKLRCQLARQKLSGLPSYHQYVWSTARESARRRFIPAQLTQIVAAAELMIQSGSLWLIQDAPTPGQTTRNLTTGDATVGQRKLHLPRKAGADVPSAGAPVPPAPETATTAPTAPETRAAAEPGEPDQPAPTASPAAPQAQFTEREDYLTSIEAKLMEKMESHQEKEAELEQREEDLRNFERQLNVLKSSLLGHPPTPPEPPAKLDEFNH